MNKSFARPFFVGGPKLNFQVRTFPILDRHGATSDRQIQCARSSGLIHLLCSHPTPPVFDGPEDSNGRRNHDEIRLWRDYVSGPKQSSWIRDDRGGTGGLDESSDFIVMGDLNADPARGDLLNNTRPIDLLLKHPRVFDPKPESAGAKVGNYRAEFEAVKRFRTSDFGRLDYVLPCRELRVVGTGVFWPGEDDPQSEFASRASDHRLVWVDLDLP